MGHVDLRIVRHLAVASLPAGALGALLSARLGPPHRMKIVIGAAVLLTAVVWMFQKDVPETEFASRWLTGRRLDITTLAYGVIVGISVGLTSVGGGLLILPFLILAHRLPAVRAVGTDLFHAMILASVSAAFHVVFGSVEWTVIPWLWTGSIPGVLVGSRLAPKMPRPALRLVLVAVLLISAFQLMI